MKGQCSSCHGMGEVSVMVTTTNGPRWSLSPCPEGCRVPTVKRKRRSKR